MIPKKMKLHGNRQVQAAGVGWVVHMDTEAARGGVRLPFLSWLLCLSVAAHGNQLFLPALVT